MNDRINYVRSLLEKKRVRIKEKRFVVEGERLVDECVGRLDFVLFSKELPLLKKLKRAGVPCHKVGHNNLKKVSDVENSQGIVGVVREPEYSMEQLTGGAKPLIVVCVDLQDPGNLGTIIRSADAAGATALVLSSRTVDKFNQKVIRASMGSIFHLPVLDSEDITETLESLRNAGIKLIAARAGAEHDLWHSNFSGPCAIILGNEGAGLPKKIFDLADRQVSIPIFGQAESLNVAMSASIMLYEVQRQRHEPYGSCQRRNGGKS